MAKSDDILAPSLQIGSTILDAEGNIARGRAMVGLAKARQVENEFEAKQLETEGQQSVGIGMINAADIARNVALVNSAAIARAAASGAGASDPTVMNIVAKTAGEGAYRQALAMYEGEAQQRLDQMRAGTLRYEGSLNVEQAQQAKKATDYGTAATVLSGAAKGLSMYEKYFS